jgi:biopolymer transport protein ExbB
MKTDMPQDREVSRKKRMRFPMSDRRPIGFALTRVATFLLVAVFIAGWLVGSGRLKGERGSEVPDFLGASEVPSRAGPVDFHQSPESRMPFAAQNQEGPIPTRNLWSILGEGGPLMIPIAMCSLVLVAVVFERMIMLRRGRVIPRPFTQRFLEQLRLRELSPPQALELCLQEGSPVAKVFAGAIRKWGRPTVEVEQGYLDAGERVAAELRRNLRVLNGVATVSPLLGLLGTVLGMIQAFNVVATTDALGRPELLAKGISQALLTTAAGLSVAIPALLAYLYFGGRVDRLLADIDALAQEVVQNISGDNVKPSETKTARAGRRKHAAEPEAEVLSGASG